MNRRFERGDVPVGCLVGLVVLLLAVLVAMRVVPIMVSVGEMDREIKILADRANRLEYSNERIKEDILYKAKALDLPFTEEFGEKNIRMERAGGRFKVWVDYTVEVDLVVYTYYWDKHHYENRPLF